MAAQLLAMLLPALAAAVVTAAECFSIGAFEGSEDATLWRDGVALVSSGLFPSPTQGGLMLAVDLKTITPQGRPTIREVELVGVPMGFGFRPHGIYIDNATQRLFAISHSDELEEESIVVFSIAPGAGDGRVPILSYRFALISPEFPWYPASEIWFLNDLGVIDSNRLLVTQFGPTQQLLVPKHLWQCNWDEEQVRPDGRLLADCSLAYPEASLGLNGMNIDSEKGRVWANDLFLSRLWVFDRDQTSGELTKLPDLQLPGVIDNVEYDLNSGDLAMGLIALGGGAAVARRADAYEPTVKVSLAGTPVAGYSVSTSLEWDKWVLLGSPQDLGPVVCNMDPIRAQRLT